MKRTMRAVFLTSLFLFPTLAFGSWGNPKVAITVHHDKRIDTEKIKTVVIDEIKVVDPEDSCGKELSALLAQDITQGADLQVVDRSNERFGKLVEELDRQGSGLIDTDKLVAQLGKIYPTGAFVFGEITRPCSRYETYTEPGPLGINVTTAQVEVHASLKVVELESSGNLLSQEYVGLGKVDTAAWLGKTAHPDLEGALTQAYDQIVKDFMSSFTEWDETLMFTAYDDSKWNLKVGAGFLTGVNPDSEKAIAAFESSLAQFGKNSTDTKTLAKTKYDLGIALIMAKRYKEAQQHLKASQQLMDSDDVRKAFEIAQRLAKSNISLVADSDHDLSDQPLPHPPTPPTESPVERSEAHPKSPPITNQDILEMLDAKMSERVILKAIDQASGNDFDVAPKALLTFKKAGASQTLIDKIQEAADKASSSSTGSPTTQSPGDSPPIKASSPTVISQQRSNSVKEPAALPPPDSAKKTTVVVHDLLSNDDIIAMVKAGTAESKILSAIDNAKAVKFEMTPDKVDLLRKNGVSNDIINHMSQARKRTAAANP